MTTFTLAQTLSAIQSQPEQTEFTSLMDAIDLFYDYTPTAFSNGLGDNLITNAAGTNEGSCRIFSFAKMNNLTQEQTLHCFGDYYRKDVLDHPESKDHGNIRCFMQYGWEGIRFDQQALMLKA